MFVKCHLKVFDNRKRKQPLDVLEDDRTKDEQSWENLGVDQKIEIATQDVGKYSLALNRDCSSGTAGKSEMKGTAENEDYVSVASSQQARSEPTKLVITIADTSRETFDSSNTSTSDHSTHLTSDQSSSAVTQTALQQVTQALSAAWGANLENCVFKFKNGRGSHVPMSMNTVKNCSSRNPLIVEICEQYSSLLESACGCESNAGASQSVTCMSSEMREVRASTVLKVIRRLDRRISRLEQTLSSLPECRNTRLENEVKTITKRVTRLQDLVESLSQSEWKGIIRRHPLW